MPVFPCSLLNTPRLSQKPCGIGTVSSPSLVPSPFCPSRVAPQPLAALWLPCVSWAVRAEPAISSDCILLGIAFLVYAWRPTAWTPASGHCLQLSLGTAPSLVLLSIGPMLLTLPSQVKSLRENSRTCGNITNNARQAGGYSLFFQTGTLSVT